MKKVAKTGIIFVIIFSLLCLSSCGKPDVSEYRHVGCNVVWDEGRPIDSEPPSTVYYKIKGVPTSRYIARKWDSDPYLMQHKDYEGKWELDVSSAKLVLVDFQIINEDWRTYGKSIIVEEVCPIDSAIIEQLAHEIASDEPNYVAKHQYFFDYPLYDDKMNFLCLHVDLKEYDNLSFVAKIWKFQELYMTEEKYYIEINEDAYAQNLLRCSDEFGAVLDKVCEKYGIDSDYLRD